ncbi:MAG: aminotransferase class I/II-fold pyridoxal phosphate-dependent enzyme [Christensenella sp.]|nr:aminotransferase class I/II-fold pyridoxal phosphate-dependent enzyme [Christensenella sp.]
MKQLSDTISNLPESGIRKLQEAARYIPGAFRLETGEPSFKTPKHICDAAYQAMLDGMTKYTAVPGIKSVREAIAEDFTRKLGCKVEYEQVVITAGAVMAIEATLRSICNPGDEVLVPDPSWPVYTMCVMANHLVPKHYVMRAENAFEPTREDLERCITDKTKAIMVNTPGNPTGGVFSRATVEMIMELAVKYDLYVIADEIYDFLIYEGEHTSFYPLDRDGRVILISGASKKYAMTGWRIGYLIASPKIVALVNQVMVMLIGNAVSFAQLATEAAIRGPQDFVAQSSLEYRARRDAAIDLLQKANIPVVTPRGAFYIMLDISSCHMDSLDFALRLLDEEKVAVAPGGTFGKSAEQMVRISYGTPMEPLCEGVERMCRFINRHSNV